MHVFKMQCYLILTIALRFAEGSFPDRDNHESDKNSIGSIEYCYRDLFFEPRCASDEVIVIRSAHFGRMQKGRCIKDDFGYIGCSADMLAFVDSSCSGRRSCQLAIARLTENINSSCPIGLAEYLEVGHECVEVAYPSKGYCDSGSSTTVGSQNGYLSSLVTQETGCGSSLTPWRVIAKPGQRIGIRLFYFGYQPLNTFSEKSECVTYVTVEETPTRRKKSLCYDNDRESSLYISQSNDVELHLTPNMHEQDNNYFLVQYEVFGCADMDPPDNGWMQRLGDDLQRGCNESSEADVNQWMLKCNGSHWVGNDYKCADIRASVSTQVPVASTTQKTSEKSAWARTTSTMSIIVIAGLAVVVFLCIVLSAMAVYIVRSRKRERMPPEESTTPNYKTQTRPSLNARQTAVVDGEGKRASATESDQYWSWQKQRRDPNDYDDDPGDGPQSGTMCSVKSHQCRLPEESTMLVRNVDNGRGRYYTGRRAPEYDKLEPGLMKIPYGETPTDHIA